MSEAVLKMKKETQSEKSLRLICYSRGRGLAPLGWAAICAFFFFFFLFAHFFLLRFFAPAPASTRRIAKRRVGSAAQQLAISGKT